MDSGIYRLTYRTGETYVGKSIHLTTRWKQHFDKLKKGTAAKNMQDAFYASGGHFPKTEVLLYCHPDMLDYYEGYFINHLRPPLNTAIPQELPELSKEVLVEHANLGFAVHSVVTLIQVMHKNANEIIELEKSQRDKDAELEELEDDFEELSQSWNDRARRDNWAKRDYRRAVDEYESLGRERNKLEQELQSLKSWRLRVEGASWWQRLWGTW